MMHPPTTVRTNDIVVVDFNGWFLFRCAGALVLHESQVVKFNLESFMEFPLQHGTFAWIKRSIFYYFCTHQGKKCDFWANFLVAQVTLRTIFGLVWKNVKGRWGVFFWQPLLMVTLPFSELFYSTFRSQEIDACINYAAHHLSRCNFLICWSI